MNKSFESSANSPSIYKIRFMPSELTNIYKNILSNVSMGEVYESFCEYVTSSIEPVGWHALWRTSLATSHDLSIEYDFEVEVMDVSHNRLEAVAVVLNLISPSEHELTVEQFDEKEKLLKESKIVNIPLIQLYVISENDTEEQYYRTAMIIEQIRFFYQNLWRPWDELLTDGQRNEIFVETRLEPRLELAFDMKDKIIPQSMVNKINHLLSEAWAIKTKIESIDQTIDMEDKSDIEDYINETDLLQTLRLKLKIDDIEREMKLLEDKHMRMIATTIKQSNNSNGFESEDDFLNSDESRQNKIHLIAKNLTLKLANEALAKLSEITNEPQIPIMFHNTVSKAIRSAKSGDKIYVMPGVYSCASLPWIENDIEINGFGETKEQIVLQSSDSVGDIFLNCNSSKLMFSGITLKATSEMQCLVMIHSGFVAFNNCILDGTNSARNTLIVLSKAKAQIDKCEVRNEREDAIISRKGSVVIIKDSSTSVGLSSKTMPNNNKTNGIQVDEEMIETPSAPKSSDD